MSFENTPERGKKLESLKVTSPLQTPRTIYLLQQVGFEVKAVTAPSSARHSTTSSLISEAQGIRSIVNSEHRYM